MRQIYKNGTQCVIFDAFASKQWEIEMQCAYKSNYSAINY